MNAIEAIQFQDKIIDEVLRKTYDPEIPVNIYELGLIYEVKVDPAEGLAHVKMTLTSPGCPAAISLPGEVEDKIRRLNNAEIKDIKIEVVWDPPWDPSRMSEAARLQLGMF
jgi:FeS assembly SUF system protein